MGYRSDVALGMGFPNAESLKVFLSSVKLHASVPYDVLETYTIRDIGGWGLDKTTHGVLMFTRFYDVKWYEGYPEVEAHKRLLRSAHDFGASTAFIRIGEDSDDIVMEFEDEHIGFGMYELFGIRRELETPAEGQKLDSFLKGDETCLSTASQ